MARIQTIEEMEQQAARLRAELEQIEAKKKAQVERRLIVIGKAMDARAQTDPEIQRLMQDVLAEMVTDTEERVLLGLAPPASSAADPGASPKRKRGRPPKRRPELGPEQPSLVTEEPGEPEASADAT